MLISVESEINASKNTLELLYVSINSQTFWEAVFQLF